MNYISINSPNTLNMMHKFSLTRMFAVGDKERDFADQRNVTMATAGASGLSAASDLEMSYPIESVPSPAPQKTSGPNDGKLKNLG